MNWENHQNINKTFIPKNNHKNNQCNLCNPWLKQSVVRINEK